MRAIWSGSISFGLVNIPVKLYSATQEEAPSFDLLHKKDLSRIRYARVCKNEEHEVPYEEIVKGYEYKKGEYVVLSNEDFERANARKTKTIDIHDFVDPREVATIYFEKPYFLEPEESAIKSYALLREALRQSGQVGIGKFVLRNKEHLVVLRPMKNMILLEQLRFEHEIRDPDELTLPASDITDEKEIKMALAFINQLSGSFKIGEYKDTYSDDLRALIRAKVEGRIPSIKGEAPTPTEVKNLMEMLKKSLEIEKEKTK